MALKRMLMELGIGTDIRGRDYTKAACRALHNAIRQNTISVAPAFGQDKDQMFVKVVIGVQKPEEVDKEEVASILPYGKSEVMVEFGGLDTPTEDGSGTTILANAAAIVYLDLPDNWREGARA